MGQGSTFHFTARLHGMAPHWTRPAPAIRGQLRGLSVLIVDDNATNRRILAEMLTNWQMRPTAVDSGAAAPGSAGAAASHRRAVHAGAARRQHAGNGRLHAGRAVSASILTWPGQRS